MESITYAELFAYLRSRGFREESPSQFERVYMQRELDMVLAVSLLDDANEDRTVREADILSIQFHLQQRGLLDGHLAGAVLQYVKGRQR